MRGPINVPGKIGALLKAHLNNKENPHGVTAAQAGAVPTSRKVNNKALSADITLSASDLGAVPTTRKVNGKALSADINLTADDVGAIGEATVTNAISAHNTNTSAHNDIRELITALTTRLNALADSDDTTLDQLSEVVAYIKNNKSLIDGITTSKVSVTDIVNDLVTNNAGKPLSAAQGVALKALIDTVSASLTSHTGNTSNPHGVTLAQLGVTATAAEINALDGCGVTNFNDLKTALAGAKIATGSYTGTGTYGGSNPCSLTFDFAPQFVYIAIVNSSNTYDAYLTSENATFLLAGLSTSYIPYGYIYNGSRVERSHAKKSSNGKTLYWYSTTTQASVQGSWQLNYRTTYYYVAIG